MFFRPFRPIKARASALSIIIKVKPSLSQSSLKMIKTAFFVSCIAAAANAIEIDVDLATSSSALADLQALMNVDTAYHTCKVTSKRTIAGDENMKEMAKATNKKPFTDPAFPHDVNMIFWNGGNDPARWQKFLKGKNWGEFEYARIKDKVPGATFKSGNIRPDQIHQGKVGNCWFLAAAASIARTPGRLDTVFEESLFKPGGYAVNLFALGVPQTTVIDDYFTFYEGKNYGVDLG